MTITTLLVPLLEAPENRTAILHAAEIARDLGAHVTVMFSEGYPSELVSPEPPTYGRVKPKLQIETRELLREQIQSTRRTFEVLVQDQGLTVSEISTGGRSVGKQAESPSKV